MATIGKNKVMRDGQEYLVSTVLLHFLFPGETQPYETMVFSIKRGKIDLISLYRALYETEEEAIAGHETVMRNFATLELHNW